MEQWQFETASPDQTRRLGYALGSVVGRGDVVFLSGELGAGKTCLAPGVARGMGVPDEIPVTRPTLVVMTFITDLERGVQLGEVLGLDGVCLVEWPEQVGLDVPALRVIMDVGEGQERIIKATASDPLHQQLLGRWRAAWSAAEAR